MKRMLTLEKMMREFWEFLHEKSPGKAPTDAETVQLIDRFMKLHPEYQGLDFEDMFTGDIAAPENQENVYVYLEMADRAKTREEQDLYLQKAKALEPDNMDVDLAILESRTSDPLELLEKLPPFIAKERKRLESQNLYGPSEGDFVKMLELRAYIYLLRVRLDCLTQCGMVGLAIQQSLEMLHLEPEDLQGIRCRLAVLYALLEDEFGLRKLWQRYPEENAYFLLPLSVLYFKLGQLDKAETFLYQMQEVYSAEMLQEFAAGVLEKNPFPDPAAAPEKTEELQKAYKCGKMLYDTVPFYFEWMAKKTGE